MGATKMISAVLDYEVYQEMKQVAKNNDIPLSELVRRCCGIGLKKISGKGAGKE